MTLEEVVVKSLMEVGTRLWEGGRGHLLSRGRKFSNAVTGSNMSVENVTNELVADEISRWTVENIVWFILIT